MSLINAAKLENKKPLSHDEALQRVYELTPQIEDYDKFMHVGARWLPYTMYFHEKNFTSNAVNTDSLGFRYVYLKGQRYSIAELPTAPTRVNLLVGGSTALGVGATSDETTVASYLSELTNEVWLNFAGRGYNSVQELIMFLMHQCKFQQIGQVLILSGINTLALEGIPDHLSSDHGRYYYSYEFQHYMNKYNEDMKRKSNSFSSSNKKPFSRLKRLKSLFQNENPADIIITDQGINLEARIMRAAGVIVNAIHQWKLLLADFHAKLQFVLQPLAYWTRDYLTPEEEAVFFAIDQCPNNFYRLFEGVLGKSVHPVFFNAIQQGALQYGIPAHDMNILLSTTDKLAETLFVDRVHFNDIGNKVLADVIYEKILSGK